MRSAVALILSCGLALVAPAASAADPQATKLFQQGLKLFERGETRAACEKFEQSYDLDPAPGTLGNLATCFETLGEHSRAHKAFIELARRAQDAGKADRADVYRQRATAIEPKLPKLVLGGPNASAWTELKIDDVDVPRDRWTGIPLEDGPHKLRFVAGSSTRLLNITMPHDGTLSVEVPPGDTAAPDLVTTRSMTTTAAPAAPTDAPPRTAGKGSSLTPLAYVLAGGGVVALGFGGFFGFRAITEKDDANGFCPAHTCASEDAAARANSSRSASETSATMSTVLVGAGVALVGAGVALYVLTRRNDATVARRLSPYGGSVVVRF